jgi:hypothetical protein
MLDLNLETLIPSMHELFVIFENNLNGFEILIMETMWMRVHPSFSPLSQLVNISI